MPRFKPQVKNVIPSPTAKIALPQDEIGFGDRGQRYEHRCSHIDGRTLTMGWSDHPEDQFKGIVEMHDALSNHHIIDRLELRKNVAGWTDKQKALRLSRVMETSLPKEPVFV